MIRIETSECRDFVTLALSGRIQAEDLPELKRVMESYSKPLVLDLTGVKTCMRDVELYRECSIRVHWLKFISRWTKEALRWEAKLSSLVTTTYLLDSMWTRKVSLPPLAIIRGFRSRCACRIAWSIL